MTATIERPQRVAAPSPPARPPQVETPRLYFPAVDGLRGAAVLSVLLYHTSWFSNGLFGVDIFMVLSGFLITLLLFREVGKTGRISVGGFYKRRFKRLMPGLSITLTLTLALSFLLAGVEEARQTGEKAIAALFQFANWQQISDDAAYWEGFGKITPLAHMWSLSITEQFYVLWPLLCVVLFWICRRSAAAVTVLMFVLLAATAAIAPLLYDGTNTDRLYLGTETRTVDFVAGAAAAGVVFLFHRRAAARRHARPERGVTALLTVIGIAALVALVAASVLTSSYHEPWLYQGGMAAVAVVTAILIATLCHDSGPLVRVFSFGPLAEMGRISYTMYLLHLPIFWVMQEQLPTIAPYALFIIGTGLTWLASMIMHYAVAERIRLRRWRPARAVPTAILVTGAIVAGGYFLPTGVERRFNPDGRPAILLLGDSLSHDLAEALTEHGTGQFAAADASISGCGVMAPEAVRPVSGIVWPTSKQCRIRDRVWRDALHRASFQAVVAHLGWDAADQLIGGRWLTPCDAEYRDRYLRQLGVAVQQVRAELPGVPLFLTNERSGTWGATPRALACYNKIIDEFTRTGEARLFDLDAMLCPPKSGCLKKDPRGDELFLDGVHFSPAGLRFVAPLLEKGLTTSLSGGNPPR